MDQWSLEKWIVPMETVINQASWHRVIQYELSSEQHPHKLQYVGYLIYNDFTNILKHHKKT